ncbi:F-box domain containing protein [Ophiocordyceps camponoti-floridani]|uniref:F-box domain containing protein n=1 Tax=Ophiocordyceps camponoti-floridani TaxID=2030778 RepID=A0A8H4Q790_9HYPO|nr:F-box domain containing protein [Ophiocordyceps camponoti-floridani]
MATKRKNWNDDDDDSYRPPPALRLCVSPPHDILSTLSDELLVRILSHMDERALLVMAPVSRRMYRIASDGQLWRRHYYRRFIAPRAHRIPGFHALRTPSFGSRRVRVGAGDRVELVDWKKEYRLRHNWARGRCAVDQLFVRGACVFAVDDECPSPEWQTLVKVVDGLAVTADAQSGLRAWDLRTRKLVAQKSLDGPLSVPPTCLAVDDQRLATAAVLEICAGFHDGTFAVWRLDVGQRKLTLLFRQEKGLLGPLVAIAYRHPYVLSAARFGFVSLYTFDSGTDGSASRDASLPSPRQITSLKSHSSRLPVALSIRNSATSVVASIAYTFYARDGWAVGIQNLDIHQPAGRSRPDVINSRVACTLPTQMRSPQSPLAWRRNRSLDADVDDNNENEEDDDEDDKEDVMGPIRLCYNHPYLLATLPDNCMVLHLCTSTDTSLTISPGTRLWGHTSGISDAEITPRGKAVSVSTRGDEIRLWELEGRVSGTSVEIRPRTPAGGDRGSETSLPGDAVSLADRKNWVGFDDEMVVVLKESGDGGESLVVYDFT